MQLHDAAAAGECNQADAHLNPFARPLTHCAPSAWTLACTMGGTNTTVATSWAPALVWSSGYGNSFPLDTTGLVAPRPCSIHLRVTDANMLSNSTGMVLQVGGGLSGLMICKLRGSPGS